MLLSMIAAADENNVIGRDNTLPWRLKADMQRVREVTRGKPLIMGRRTHESIGQVLPGRLNIVVTSKPASVLPGATVASSFDEAVSIARESGAAEAIVFGGQAIYEAAMATADRIYLTRVHTKGEGDAYFPAIPQDQWQVISEERHEADADNEHAMTFLVCERSGGAAG